MNWHKIKLDPNDTLYSKIIRYGKISCDRCYLVGQLSCAHIMSRRFYTTRFLLHPKPNAVALCASCHDWFDTHKITRLLFDEKVRVLNQKDESYTWLVRVMGYSWDELARLYALSKTPYQGYKWKKKEINFILKKELEILESGQ